MKPKQELTVDEPGYKCREDPAVTEARHKRRQANREKKLAKLRYRNELDLLGPRKVKDPWNPFSTKVARAKVLLASGLDKSKVARACNLDWQTVAKVARGEYDPMIPPGLIEQMQASESSKLTMAVAKCVDEILENPTKIAGASLQQLGTTAAILIDKRELLDGRPTARTEYLFKMGDEEIEGEMVKAYQELRQRLASKGHTIDVTGASEAEIVPDQAEAQPGT